MTPRRILIALPALLLIGWAAAQEPAARQTATRATSPELVIQALDDASLSVTVRGAGLEKPLALTIKPLPKGRMEISSGQRGSPDLAVGGSNPFARTFFKIGPFGERIEGLSYCVNGTQNQLIRL